MLHLSKVSRASLIRQKGLSAIEFTLALPFMLLMFAIFVEFGRVYIQQTTLTKAVQDGARYAVSSHANNEQIKYVVIYGIESPSTNDLPLLPGLDIVLDETSDGTIAIIRDDYITVVVSYPYTPLLLNTAQFEDDGIFSGLNNLNRLIGIKLSASSVMRKSL